MADPLLVVQARAMNGASLGEWHDWLCHPNGEVCPDGCDQRADRERLDAMLLAEGVEPEPEPSDRLTIPTGSAPSFNALREAYFQTSAHRSIFDDDFGF